jgi:hypothetical protein
LNVDDQQLRLRLAAGLAKAHGERRLDEKLLALSPS